MKTLIKDNFLLILLSFLFLILGIFTYKDYGVGIEEHFQRKSGFYWLNYLLNSFGTETFRETALLKYNEILTFTPNLFDIKIFNIYGILFDLPLAFLETIFNIEEPQEYFYLRHIANFIIFLISGIFLYALLKKRFNNYYTPLIGFVLYILTPRMYGNSFFDGKDLFFLSIFTINFYFYFNFIENRNYKNLIILSLFCALTTSTRIIGLLFPLCFLFLLFLTSFTAKSKDIIVKYSIVFIISYLTFLYLHWPYLWTLDLNGVSTFFKPFFYSMNPTVFFNGEFYKSKYLPVYYVPLWIMITTPIYYLIMFFSGFYLQFSKLFKRIITIEENYKIKRDDLWSTSKEQLDVFIFFNFFAVIILFLSVNLVLISGWRHFYFLNFFIIYYSCYSYDHLFEKYKNYKKILNSILLVIFLLTLEVIFKLYIYHPHQSSYFNNLVTENYKKNFQIDTQSLSRVDAIKEVLKDSKQKEKIVIGTASWTPLEDARSMIKRELWDKLVFTGTSNKEKADYIFSNHYYEVNNKFNKKYEIPENFYLYKKLVINGTHIYSLFKRKI